MPNQSMYCASLAAITHHLVPPSSPRGGSNVRRDRLDFRVWQRWCQGRFRWFLLPALLVVLLMAASLAVAAEPQCSNRVDDNGDGLVDFPADPGCTSGTDNTELGNPPTDRWIFCANEHEFCAFSGSREVRYGANGTFTEPRTFTDGVQCDNSVFGDPVYGVVKHCDTRPVSTGGDFPASYFTGPLGNNNILPPKNPGAFVGVWGPGANDGTATWPAQQQGKLNREAFAGRKFDWHAIHYASPNDQCHYGAGNIPFASGREQWLHDQGQIPVVNWTHGWTAASVNAGAADACIRAMARNAAALPFRVLLRIYWEFNGTWMRWTSVGQEFIDMWRRTVRLFRVEGATNVGFVWSPDGGHRDRANISYPGDEWVDWNGMSLYNMNRSTVWCSPFWPGWCEYSHVLSHDPVNYPTMYDIYSPRKPFATFETGSVEDTASRGRKGQWLRNIRDQVPTCCQRLRGIVYFDMDVSRTEGFNWRLDSSASALEGWRDLVRSAFFDTQGLSSP
jgi:hypothetical protein